MERTFWAGSAEQPGIESAEDDLRKTIREQVQDELRKCALQRLKGFKGSDGATQPIIEIATGYASDDRVEAGVEEVELWELFGKCSCLHPAQMPYILEGETRLRCRECLKPSSGAAQPAAAPVELDAESGLPGSASGVSKAQSGELSRAEKDDLESDDDDGEIYCECCNQLLNGPTQLEDHKKQQSHRKKFKLIQGVPLLCELKPFAWPTHEHKTR